MFSLYHGSVARGPLRFISSWLLLPPAGAVSFGISNREQDVFLWRSTPREDSRDTTGRDGSCREHLRLGVQGQSYLYSGQTVSQWRRRLGHRYAAATENGATGVIANKTFIHILCSGAHVFAPRHKSPPPGSEPNLDDSFRVSIRSAFEVSQE